MTKEDDRLPAYGFGDINTKDVGVFSFLENETPCAGFKQVLLTYSEIAPRIQCSGPTSFVPIIEKAIEITSRTGGYHILLIVCDGQVDDVDTTRAAIGRASHFPLSIVAIGVGDGPFDFMHHLDNSKKIPRLFDNFQFVEFNQVVLNPLCENVQVAFALAAMQEIPDSYKAIKKFGLLTPTQHYAAATTSTLHS